MIVPVEIQMMDHISWKLLDAVQDNARDCDMTVGEARLLTQDEIEEYNRFVLAAQHATYAMVEIAERARKRAGKAEAHAIGRI